MVTQTRSRQYTRLSAPDPSQTLSPFAFHHSAAAPSPHALHPLAQRRFISFPSGVFKSSVFSRKSRHQQWLPPSQKTETAQSAYVTPETLIQLQENRLVGPSHQRDLRHTLHRRCYDVLNHTCKRIDQRVFFHRRRRFASGIGDVQ